MISIVVEGTCYNVSLTEDFRPRKEDESISEYSSKLLTYNKLRSSLRSALDALVLREGVVSGVKFYKALSGLGLSEAKRVVENALNR